MPPNIREAVIRHLHEAMKREVPLALSSYDPKPATNGHDRVMDATIVDTLHALQNNKRPTFSGVSGVGGDGENVVPEPE